MKPNQSQEFNTFKDFVRKIVSVPKAEIDTIKEQEQEEKKSAPKKQPAKVKT